MDTRQAAVTSLADRKETKLDDMNDNSMNELYRDIGSLKSDMLSMRLNLTEAQALLIRLEGRISGVERETLIMMTEAIANWKWITAIAAVISVALNIAIEFVRHTLNIGAR